MSIPRFLSVLSLASSLSLATLLPAHAEELTVESENILLAAVLPALAGTELGQLVVAESPLPGASRVVRASDIKAVLKANGHDARGLDLPRSVRFVRRARTVGEAELLGRVRDAVAAQVAPCEMVGVSTLPVLSLGAGDYEVVAQATPRRVSGRVPLVITLKQGERTQRISAQLDLFCPAPVIQPGQNVRVVSVSGRVRVSAPATAQQAGRVGDEIRVTNQVTKTQLRARVIDAHSVEVLP